MRTKQVLPTLAHAHHPEVAQSVRVARAHDISQLDFANVINEGLIRWIVDLNFGTNVLAPKIYRDFEIKDDVSTIDV